MFEDAFASFRALIFAARRYGPLGVLADLQSAVKKVRPLFCGFVIRSRRLFHVSKRYFDSRLRRIANPH